MLFHIVKVKNVGSAVGSVHPHHANVFYTPRYRRAPQGRTQATSHQRNRKQLCVHLEHPNQQRQQE